VICHEEVPASNDPRLTEEPIAKGGPRNVDCFATKASSVSEWRHQKEGNTLLVRPLSLAFL
jgi:hypothetical protein